MFKFLTAKHRSAYIDIALKYKVWPEKVYRIAHGHRAKGNTETRIAHELLSLGIIHRRSESSFGHKSEDKVVFH